MNFKPKQNETPPLRLIITAAFTKRFQCSRHLCGSRMKLHPSDSSMQKLKETPSFRLIITAAFTKRFQCDASFNFDYVAIRFLRSRPQNLY